MSLDRSGNLPLSLKALRKSEHRNLQYITDIILPFSERWEHIYLPASIVNQLAAAKNKLSSLKSIEVYLDKQTCDSLYLDAFENAPQLCSVRFGYHSLRSLPKLPWLQLTECVVNGTYVDDLFRLLPRIENVENAKFTLIPSRVYYYDVIATRLSRLVSLELTEDKTTQFTNEILNTLTLPALHDLCIHSSSPLPHGTICSLLMRSSCSLRRLVLDCERAINVEGLVQCLELTPMLTELELGPYIFISKEKEYICFRKLSMATSDSSGLDLVPRLEAITVGSVSSLRWPVFVDMIESRWKVRHLKGTSSGTQLRSVRVTAQRDSIGMLTIDRLCQMQTEGLDIAIFSDFQPCEQIL
jgi:hypothetical protein